MTNMYNILWGGLLNPLQNTEPYSDGFLSYLTPDKKEIKDLRPKRIYDSFVDYGYKPKDDDEVKFPAFRLKDFDSIFSDLQAKGEVNVPVHTTISGENSCRESVLAHLTSFYNTCRRYIPGFRYNSTSYFFVEVYSMNGRVTDSHMKFIERFFENFNDILKSMDIYYFSAKRPDGRNIPVLCMPSGKVDRVLLYRLSFFLYVIRIPELMKQTVYEFNNTKNLFYTRLMTSLSRNFLRNTSYGNIANSPLALSFYAFLESQESSLHNFNSVEFNGPVNFSQVAGNSVHNIYNYIKYIFYPEFGSKMGEYLPGNLHPDYLVESFLSDFLLMWKFFISELKEKNNG